MLVLGRELDQAVMIGSEIEVRIMDIRGDKVRLGFTAPKDVPIHRKEVYAAIQREKQAAETREVAADVLPRRSRREQS